MDKNSNMHYFSMIAIMKKIKSLSTALFFSFFLFSSFYSTAQRLTAKKKVVKELRLANDYFMNKWPDPGKTIITNKERKSNIWTRSVYYEGLMGLYAVEPDPKERKRYFDYAYLWGEKHHWNLNGGITIRNADNQCAGQTYYDLYVLTGKKNKKMIDSLEACISLMMATNKVDDWSWIDALQMGMPVFVRLGTELNDPAYFNRMYDMYAYTKYRQGGNGLYNQKDNLWWRDENFEPPYKEPNGEDCYWSRGNGWVLAALVRTLDMLPQTDPHYKEYLQDYKDMCKALLPLQRTDGFWNVSLHDPTHFGGKELTGTALFIYGFAYGINKGWLNKKLYKPAVAKAWNGMVKDCVKPNGFLGWVQGTGKEPKDGQPLSADKVPDFEDFGLGCFLLAGSEVYKIK